MVDLLTQFPFFLLSHNKTVRMMTRQFQELEKRFEKSKFSASFLIAIYKN